MIITNWWWSCNTYSLGTVSAEGRVEHQKLNQTTALLLFCWVFGVQLDSLEKSVLANNEKRVDIIPTFVAT